MLLNWRPVVDHDDERLSKLDVRVAAQIDAMGVLIPAALFCGFFIHRALLNLPPSDMHRFGYLHPFMAVALLS